MGMVANVELGLVMVDKVSCETVELNGMVVLVVSSVVFCFVLADLASVTMPRNPRPRRRPYGL